MASRCLFILLLLSVENEVRCGIFAGAIFMWEPTGNSAEIIINAQIAWNRSRLLCVQDTITNDSTVGFVGLSCLSGCSKPPDPFPFGCSAFNESNEWATGSGSVLFTPDSDVFSFGLKDSIWTENVNGASTLRHVTKANVTVRSDTGRINSAPRIDIPLFLTIEHGCNHSIVIPVTDADGDVFRCRFASPNNTDGLDECGSICSGFQTAGATIDPDTCTINYLANDGNVWHGVSIQVEDFVSEDSQTALSSIAVQFIISVIGTSTQCPEVSLGEPCPATVIKPCNDPNAECTNGTCQCQYGYYGTNGTSFGGTCEARASETEDSLIDVYLTVPVAPVGLVIILLAILFLRRRKRQRNRQTQKAESIHNQLQDKSSTSTNHRAHNTWGKEPETKSRTAPSNSNGFSNCYVVFDSQTGERGSRDKSNGVKNNNLSDDVTNCYENTSYDVEHVYTDFRRPATVDDNAYQTLHF